MSGKPVLQALSLVVVATLAACSGGSPAATGTARPTPSAVPAAPTVTIAPTVAPAPSVEATPTAFTSAVYGYGLTVPAGWAIGPALIRWDGTSAVGHDDPFVDKFASPGTLSFFAFAKPYKGTLDAFAKDEIAATVRDHSDTCLHPDPPAANEPITVAGQPGVFLAWDCGILINQVVTVRNGMAFAMVSRDTAIQTATNPADRALLDQVLSTLRFPG